MITTGIAVESLRPDTEWVMHDNDVANITWHTPGVEPLTETQVAAEMLRLAQVAADAEATRVAARESAMVKLAMLGLNDSEVEAMMGGV